MTRRPMDGARLIRGDTATHAAYGVGPATDYGADEGEPVFAPFAGRVGGWWSDTGGNTVQVVGDGVTFIGQHLMQAPDTGYFTPEGKQIALTGNTGSATSGPHLHCWIEYRGQRMSFEHYCGLVGLGETPLDSHTPDASTAGGDISIITEPEEETEMYGLYSRTDNGVVTLALGIKDPNWRTAGRNFWAEAPASQVRDWVELFGPVKAINNDIWDSRSNDAGRIGDMTKFPPMTYRATVAAPVPAPAIDYTKLAAALPPLDVAAIARAVNDDAAARLRA